MTVPFIEPRNAGWECPVCGIVWAPWFPGPCTHEQQTEDEPVPPYIWSSNVEFRASENDCS